MSICLNHESVTLVSFVNPATAYVTTILNRIQGLPYAYTLIWQPAAVEAKQSHRRPCNR